MSDFNPPPPPEEPAGGSYNPQPTPPPGQPAPQFESAGVQKVDAKGRPLAQWWERVVAAIVDALILAVPGFILGLIFISIFGLEDTEARFTGFGSGNIGLSVLSAVIGIAYYGYFHGQEHGQTPGKKVMKIAVRDELNAESIGQERAFIRAAVYQGIGFLAVIPILGLAGLLNVLWPLWDEKRQTWHDKVAKSVVSKVG